MNLNYMNTKNKPSIFLLIFLLLTNIGFSQQKSLAGKQPNILFLLADDMSFDMLGIIGRHRIHTPNLDRLAKRGAMFTHSFNQGSFHPAVCASSRAMLITGTSLWKAASFVIPEPKGANDPQAGPEYQLEQGKQATTYWPQYLQKAGYTTYFTGKWHISADPTKLFDHTATIRPGGMPNQSPASDNRTFNPMEKDGWSPSDSSLGGYWQGGKHWTEQQADDVISFLRQAAGQKAPFFIYAGFNAPHDPRQSPSTFVDRYSLDSIELPRNFLPQYPYALAAGSGMHLRDERLAPLPRTPYSIKKSRQEYFAIISHLDAEIGRILDELDKTPMSENTYIIFTADNGLAIGDHGFMGKNNMYDASMRVPMLMAGPGIPANTKVNAPVYMQDIMPTSLHIAGIPVPDSIDFHNLLPLAKRQTVKGAYPVIYGAYFGVQRMIRTNRFKMIIYPVTNTIRLYDLKNDPDEITDLAAMPKYRKRIMALFQELKEVQKELNDPVDMTPFVNSFLKQMHPES